jgi:hypothetical protein
MVDCVGGVMSSDAEFDELCEKAMVCRSEEEAFEIIRRLRPYFQSPVDTQAGSSKDGTKPDEL